MTQEDQIRAQIGWLRARGVTVSRSHLRQIYLDVLAGPGAASRRRARRASWRADAAIRDPPDHAGPGSTVTILDCSGVPVVILRVATLTDVRAFGRRTPDEIDRQAVTTGAYVVIRDVDTNPALEDRLCRSSDLHATGGRSEIDRMIGFAVAAALGYEVTFFVEEKPADPPASATCVRVTFDPITNQVSLVAAERYPQEDAWTWVRDSDVEVSRDTLESIVLRVRRAAQAYAVAQQARQAGDPGPETVDLASTPGSSWACPSSPWVPELGDACEVQLDVTGDRWWRVRYLGSSEYFGSSGRLWKWRFRMQPFDLDMPRLAIVVQMRPTASDDRPGRTVADRLP